MKKYELLATDGRARRGRFTTPHGVIETPVFMNVGTVAAIKGAVSTMDLHGTGGKYADSVESRVNDCDGI